MGRIRNSKDARLFWQQHNIRQRKLVQAFFPKILKELKKQVSSFIEGIEERGVDSAIATIDQLVKFEGIAEAVKGLYLKAAYVESNYVLRYVKEGKKAAPIGISLDSLLPMISEWSKIYLLNNSALPITDYTKKIMTDKILKELDNGRTYEEAVANLKDYAITSTSKGGQSYNRAMNISKTESTRAMSFGSLIGAWKSGVDLEKVWVTSDDERVRGYHAIPRVPFPHTDLDLQVADIFADFNNGEPIRFPGDPEASLDNIAGCRCSLYFREKKKPRIPKPSERISDRISGRVRGGSRNNLMNFLTAFLSGFMAMEEILDAI